MKNKLLSLFITTAVCSALMLTVIGAYRFFATRSQSSESNVNYEISDASAYHLSHF